MEGVRMLCSLIDLLVMFKKIVTDHHLYSKWKKNKKRESLIYLELYAS